MPHPFRRRPSPPHFQHRQPPPPTKATSPVPALVPVTPERLSNTPVTPVRDTEDDAVEVILGSDRRRRVRHRGQRRDTSMSSEDPVITMRSVPSRSRSPSDRAMPSPAQLPSVNVTPTKPNRPAASSGLAPSPQHTPTSTAPGLGRRRGVEAVMRHLKDHLPAIDSSTAKTNTAGLFTQQPPTPVDPALGRHASSTTPMAIHAPEPAARHSTATSTADTTPVADNYGTYFPPPYARDDEPGHEILFAAARAPSNGYRYPVDHIETTRAAVTAPLTPLTPRIIDASSRDAKPILPITAFPRHIKPDYPIHQRPPVIGRMLPIPSADLPVTKPFPLSPPPYDDADVPPPEPYNAGFPHPVTAYTSPGVNPQAVERSGYLAILQDLVETDPQAMTGSIIAELGRADLTAPALTLEAGNKDGCGIPEKFWLRLSTWAGVKIPIGTVIPFARSSYPRPSMSLAPRFMPHSPSLPIDVIFPSTPSSASLDPPTPYRGTYALHSDDGLGPAPAHMLRHAYSAAELNRAVSPSASLLLALSRRRSERELHGAAGADAAGYGPSNFDDVHNRNRAHVEQHDYTPRDQVQLCPNYVQYGFCRYQQLCRYDHGEYITRQQDTRQQDSILFSHQQQAYDQLPSSLGTPAPMSSLPPTPTSARYDRHSSAPALALATVKETDDDSTVSRIAKRGDVEPIGSELLRARRSAPRLSITSSATDLRLSHVASGTANNFNAMRAHSALDSSDSRHRSVWSTGSSSLMSSLTSASGGSLPASSAHASETSPTHESDAGSAAAHASAQPLLQPGMAFTPFSPPGTTAVLPEEGYEQAPFTPPHSPHGLPQTQLPRHSDNKWTIEHAQTTIDFSRGKSIWC